MTAEPGQYGQRMGQLSCDLHAAGQYDEADKALDEAQLAYPRHVAPVAPREFRREQWECSQPGTPEWGASNLVSYAHREAVNSARQVFASYYSIPIGAVEVLGQRTPPQRLQYLPLDFFRDKSVLDVGGNFGGMLHSLRSQIRWGIGTDYDARMVNAANRIAAHNKTGKLRFYVHDLEEEPLDLLVDLMPEPSADVVLLLSVCAHLKNWREVIARCARLCDQMIFEANGHEWEQLGQLRALYRAFGEVRELAGRGAPGIGSRRLLLCDNPK